MAIAGRATTAIELGAAVLLSTFASCSHTAGAEAQLVVTVDGKKLRYDLAQLGTMDGRRRR